MRNTLQLKIVSSGSAVQYFRRISVYVCKTRNSDMMKYLQKLVIETNIEIS